MLRRIAALLMVLLFAGQAMAGGIVCGIDAISNGLNQSSESSEASCPMEKSGACDMACCMLGKSPTGAIGPMICCEVKCGESTGGAQFEFAPFSLALAPPSITVRIVSLEALGEAEASIDAVFLKSAENSFLHREPPPLFLQNSTFLN